ncbi:YDG domain-containing protein, partial [Niastella vici]|uniref:YDG domain-containing protein n=1 Tax=Niastella vici TaxID=1703345 RepID=UPI00118101AE
PAQVYDTKHVGSNKTLTASGLVINDGNSGNNYHIIYTTNTTGVISVRDINVTAQTDSRVYNGTTSSSVAPVVDALQTGDAIGTAPTQVYNSKHVANNKTMTASGLIINDGNGGLNYAIHYVTNNTGIITRRDLDVTAQHDERVYNGNTSSSVVPVTGALQTGDVIGTAPIQTFDTKNVGTNKTLTPASLVINDGNSGLNYLVHYITDGTGIITKKGITGNVTANNKVYDGNRNASIATRTLTGVILYDAVTYTGGAATFDDVPPGTGQNVGTNKPVTATGLSLTGADALNYSVNTSAATTANITTAGLTITANDLTTQYSDPVGFSVSYSGFASGDGPGSLGGSLTYTTTPAATTGTSPVIATGAPGVYTITPAGLTSGNYSITFKTGTLTITKEDAQVTYTGLTLVATTTPTSSTANLTLSATIQDITAVSGDPAYDVYAGDIRKATVTFNIDGVDKATVPIGLVNGSDTKTGTAITTVTGVGIGDHTVLIKLNGYYIGTAAGDNSFVVEVFQNTGDFITGGGYLKLTNSSGQKPGDAGTKNNFGFNIKYNKGGTNLQGTINTIIRRMEGGVLHVYQVKGNSMTSLTVNGTATPPTAVFNGKANVTDITNPASPISIGGNYTLQVSMTDQGEPGTNDKIGITVFNKDGGIWYTSNWDGTQTIQQTLGGGNLVVHGSNVGTAPIARTETGNPAQTVTTVPNNPFIVKVYGNPTMDHFNISISGSAEKISLRVIDIRGRLIEYRENVPQGTLQLGDLYYKGFYYLEVWQGNHIRQLKLVKL